MPSRSKQRRLPLVAFVLCVLTPSPTAAAQVHHYPDGRPWNQRADAGPDAEVPGWFYGLGITGIRVRLDDDLPTHLIVEHVFADSPADGRVRVGDHIVGADGQRFETPHRNGYGMEVFGPAGPIEDFARALEAAQGTKSRRLSVTLLRDGEEREARLRLPKAPAYADTFPFDCQRTGAVRERLLEHLLAAQKDDGSWGNPVHDTFAPLALLSRGERTDMRAVEKNARYHARTTQSEDAKGLVNWRYTAAAIVLSEYYLRTGAKWVPDELREVRDFLASSQYMDVSQINPKAKESHPHSYPKEGTEKIGGWGHNIGFEGYGPIAMVTGQGALAYTLMGRAGLEIDEVKHRAAYDFLARGTGRNGYLWYADEVAGDDKWADMGRTGASGIAHWLSPFEGHAARALIHAVCIGENPLSFPDTHGSPLMGMAYTALAAWTHRPSFERLMEANRWWFVLAECPDGTFHYQPNRDNAGYGSDARLAATAVAAFILSIPEKGLVITGAER